MKLNQVATLTLRLLGIYCLIASIPHFSVLGNFIVLGRLRSAVDAFGLLLAFLPGVFMLVTGVLLLVLAGPLAATITPQAAAETTVTPISHEHVEALAFAVAGVLIFFSALPQLISSFFVLINAAASQSRWAVSPTYVGYTLRDGLVAVGTILKAAAGLVLFFRARGFANFWRSMRNFATPTTSSQQ